MTPKGRRGHTAIVFEDSMYIYGGYQDLRGSSSELWAFHFPSQTWHYVSQGGAADCPPRHHHSAIVHDSAMWIFGGMSDLLEMSDCWKFDLGNNDVHLYPNLQKFSVSRCWHPVRSKPGPGCLHSHSAVKMLNQMLVFGGEKEGQTVNEIWRFHFGKFLYCLLDVNNILHQLLKPGRNCWCYLLLLSQDHRWLLSWFQSPLPP